MDAAMSAMIYATLAPLVAPAAASITALCIFLMLYRTFRDLRM